MGIGMGMGMGVAAYPPCVASAAERMTRTRAARLRRAAMSSAVQVRADLAEHMKPGGMPRTSRQMILGVVMTRSARVGPGSPGTGGSEESLRE